MVLVETEQKTQERYLPPGLRAHKIHVVDKAGKELHLTPEEFQEFFDVEYIPHLRADKGSTLSYAHKCYQKGLNRGFFNTERRWLGRFFRKKIEEGLVDAVSIRFISDLVGWGLYAERGYGQFDYIGVYTGQLRRRSFLRLNSNDYCFTYPTGTWSSRPLMIDAEPMGNETRFINHSDDPNVEAFGVPVNSTVHVLMRTTRPVEKGEQLTFDYGSYFWKQHDGPKISI